VTRERMKAQIALLRKWEHLVIGLLDRIDALLKARKRKPRARARRRGPK